MNQYEAIFLRKSVKQFRMEPVDPGVLAKIAAFYEEINPLFPGIRTEIGITPNTQGQKALKGLFGLQAPYYLSIYSEKRDRSDMNAGYIAEQLCLYMMTIGLGSCFLGSDELRDAPKSRGEKKFVILIAFGKPKGSLIRRSSEARRLPLKELCVFKDQPKKWMTNVIEAARLAPSSLNRQPWRFVVVGNRIHIFCRSGNMDRPKKWNEFDFGVMFAHIAVASDELWLDVDLIRLENISQKSFRVNQYVLSAIVKAPDWQEEEGRNGGGDRRGPGGGADAEPKTSATDDEEMKASAAANAEE